MKIKNSIAFVTGANRGLGHSFAQELLVRGALKVYAGVREPGAFKAPGIIPIKLDVNDLASIAAAAAQCPDVSLLINNAGIARLTESTLDPALVAVAREIFETNFYGVVSTTQAFAPALARSGGGAVINVLSDASWFARPTLAAYSATKSAAWSFTNALRLELRDRGTQVLALHVGFMDTDMTKGFDMKKTSPAHVAARTLDALEAGEEEVLADEETVSVKQGLSAPASYYLNPPPIA
jgi:NAD(P)-dependent dehydrogenase (short-subunit alcohol dehydrogenase family)